MDTRDSHKPEIDLSEIKSNKAKVKDLLSSINVDKIDNIKQVITEINDLIEERKNLSNKLILSCDKLVSKINGIAMRIPQENLKEEILLQEKMVGLEETKLNEQLNCWRDVALLKRELREKLHEFREQESAQNTYSDLLND